MEVGHGVGARTARESQHVLLLDPDLEAAPLLASQLRHAGFDIQMTTTYRCALQAIEFTRFGAIVAVADLTVTEHCRDLLQIRHSALGSWLVVIADRMTGREDEFRQFLKVDELLRPPFSVSDLIRSLSTQSNRDHSGR
jgi:DNA-binding response OmpR family regulator